MKLYFRFFLMLIRSFLFPEQVSTNQPFVRHFRVLPTDLDFNLHVTNSRYLAFADLLRIELLKHAGFLAGAIKHGWVPVVNCMHVHFNKELRLGQRFSVTARVVHQDARWIYIEYHFKRGAKTVAKVLEKSGALKRGDGMQEPAAVFELIGQPSVEGEPESYVREWIHAQAAVRKAIKEDSP